MKSIKNKIPELLIYSRLAIAWIMLIIGLLNPLWAKTVISILLVVGLLTDVLDGIIARHLKISTAHLRQLDTKIDRIFWLSALFTLMLIHPAFLIEHWIGLSILLLLELSAWVIGKIKFRNSISFHSLLSKFWAISILITFIDVLPDGKANFSFSITFWYGLLAQIDIIFIAFILPEFQCDIPSSWHASKIRSQNQYDE